MFYTLIKSILLLYLLVFSQSVNASITLVKNQVSSYCIYYSVTAPSSVRLAALEMQEYLYKSTGVLLPIVLDIENQSCLWISIGDNLLVKQADIAIKTIPLEGYRIVTKGSTVYIVGKDTKDKEITAYGGVSNGTLNGVYTFLEKYIGIRWFIPGEIGEDVPQYESLIIPYIDATDKPVFSNRRIATIQNDNTLVKQWLRRNKQGFSLQLNHGHNFTNIITADLYKKHQDWFAMQSKVREQPFGNYKLETTNPELVEAFSNKVSKAFYRDRNLYSYSISPSDGANWSTSPESLSLYDKDPYGRVSLTKLVLDFYNKVAKNVEKKYPNKLLCGYIYSDYLYPPSDGIPNIRNNLCLVIAPSFSYGYGLYKEQERNDLDRLLSAWTAATDNLAYYDLPVKFIQSLGAPNPPGIEILEYLYPNIAKNGIKGVYIYGIDSWGHGALTNYLIAKLNWNPYANVRALFDEFFIRFYGPSTGLIMAKLYKLLDSAAKEYYLSNKNTGHYLSASIIKGVYIKILHQINKLILQVQQTIKTEKQETRIKLFMENYMRFYNYLVINNYVNKHEPAKTSNDVYDLAIYEDIKEQFPYAVDPNRVTPSEKKYQYGRLFFTKIPPLSQASQVQTYNLRGSSRILVYADQTEKIKIGIRIRNNYGESVEYKLKNQFGQIISEASATKDDTIQFVAEKGTVYFIEINAKHAIYSVDIRGGRFAVYAKSQKQGLHLISRLTPVYFFVPRLVEEFSLIIGSNSMGETVAGDIIAPTGETVESFDTSGYRVKKLDVKKRARDSGFWKIEWKKPERGVVDDVWIRMDDKLSPWIIMDPQKPLIITDQGKQLY